MLKEDKAKTDNHHHSPNYFYPNRALLTMLIIHRYFKHKKVLFKLSGYFANYSKNKHILLT